MPRGVYARKKRSRKASEQDIEKTVILDPQPMVRLNTDRSRLDLLESLPDPVIYKPRYVGELTVVRSGTAYGLGHTVREALDDLAARGN